MDNKNKFQEMLGDILEVARVQGNRLEREEIKALFGDMELNEAQYEHIFAYLAANHIKIDGYVEVHSEYTKAVQRQGQDEEQESEDASEEQNDSNIEKKVNHTSQEDSIFLKMYLEDLEAIKASTLKEEEDLIQKIRKGDDFAKNRFVEINLRYVVEIAKGYKNKGITVEDLIQEGNIGLLSSLESLSDLENNDNWKEFITDFVKKYIEAAIDEQKDSSNLEGKVLDKIKYINDAANELAEDLGREADIMELSACTKISVEELQSILNVATDAVKVSSHHHEEAHSCGGHHHEDGHSCSGHHHEDEHCCGGNHDHEDDGHTCDHHNHEDGHTCCNQKHEGHTHK